MPTLEGLRIRLFRLQRDKLAPLRRRHLKNDKFTIISNNCWGGTIYESYGLQKNSPTVGLFFMAEDYIRFLSRMDEYLSAELTFIPPDSSRWRAAPQVSGDKRFGSYPVGKLSLPDESIELFFLHYANEQQAKEKWERRCRRIDRDRLIVKFNDQNGCAAAHIDAFAQLPYANKLFFTAQNWENAQKWQDQLGTGYLYIRQFPAGGPVRTSYEPFGHSRVLDVTNYINSLQ